jgi:hypothetical protein
MTSFEAIAELDRAALEGMLAHRATPSEQRVWAIWALALRGALDPGVQLARERAPGVRRALAVLLAGDGRHQLLLELAHGDPATEVRATAFQLLTRLGAGGAVELAPVIAAAEAPGPVAIPLAIFAAIGPGAPAPLIALADRALDAPAAPLELRLEAFEALVRIGTVETRRLASGWMVRRGRDELPEICARWLRFAAPATFARAFAAEPVDVRLAVLAQLRAPAWSDIGALIGAEPALLQAALARPDIMLPLHVLVAATVRGLNESFAERLALQIEEVLRGHGVLAALRREIAGGADSGSELVALATDYLARLVPPVRDPGNQRLRVLAELAAAHPVEQLLGLEHAVTRWMAPLGELADLTPHLHALQRICATHPNRSAFRVLRAALTRL